MSLLVLFDSNSGKSWGRSPRAKREDQFVNAVETWRIKTGLDEREGIAVQDYLKKIDILTEYRVGVTLNEIKDIDDGKDEIIIKVKLKENKDE